MSGWQPKVVDGPQPQPLIFVQLSKLTLVQRVKLPPDCLVSAQKFCGQCHGRGRFAGRPCPCLMVMITPYHSKLKNIPGEPLRRFIVPGTGELKDKLDPDPVEGQDPKEAGHGPKQEV